MTLDPGEPLPSLTVQIFNAATGPYPEEHRLAWAGMLLLLILLLTLNGLVRWAARTIIKGHSARA
jgi:phosphate transport system permease protein